MTETTTFESTPVAVVTGAARGLGYAIALRLARDGFDIAANDMPAGQGGLRRLDGEVSAIGRRLLPVPGDVTEPEQVAHIFQAAQDAFDRLDVVVSNAGINRPKMLMDTSASDWDRIFAVNARGMFLVYREAAARFIAQGRGGRIIGAGSLAAHRAAATIGPYSASKYAVRGLTEAAAQEWAPYGITVNAFSPGVVGTPLWEETDGEYSKMFGVAAGATFASVVDRMPLGRAQTPEDVAGLVSFLASGDAGYLTGQTILMDGGFSFA